MFSGWRAGHRPTSAIADSSGELWEDDLSVRTYIRNFCYSHPDEAGKPWGSTRGPRGRPRRPPDGSDGAAFHPSHVRILKGKLKKDGPEVKVWYFAMRPADQFNARDDMYLLWPMPRHILADCLETWRYQLHHPRVVQLLQTPNLPKGTCKAFNPVLNGWAKSTTHSTEVPTLWRRLRLYARLKGRWRAALRAWYDEVHHRPQHICKKDEHGETEAARAMEAEMAAPVFTAGRLQ